MKKLNFIIATVSSALSGALIGILFAPDKGSKTRQKISKETEEYLDRLRDEVRDMRKHINERADKTRQGVGELQDEARKKGEDLVDRAKKMTSYDEWTKQELYDRAKELGVDNYSQMNKSELINALRNR